jgi:NADPH-dependent dioxygenase
MKSHRVDVLVAGAGPVGLATALFAADRGQKVMVIDAKPRGVAHSYALALHPATLDLLDQVDVCGDILARALPVRSMAVYADGRRIATIPVAPPGAKYPFLAVVGQDVLESVLSRVLVRRGARLAWSHRLSSFTTSPNGVEADVDELEECEIGYAAARFEWMVKSTHRIAAKFLVGTDGHDSLVRRQLGIGFPDVRPAEHFAVFEFQHSDAVEAEIALVLHPDGLGVLWPLPGGRARWSFAVSPESNPDAEREKDHEPVQIFGPGVFPSLDEVVLQKLLATRAPWFRGKLSSVYWRMLVRFERRLAAGFGQPRVWLAGDAGHLTGPAGIQSMNVGIREACDVAQGIAATDNTGLADAFGAYEAARIQEWRQLLGLSGRLSATSAAKPEIAAHADRLLPCLPASGPALAALAQQLGLTLAP